MKNLAKLGLLSVLALTACKEEETEEVVDVCDTYSSSHFVINEGGFQAENASISAVDASGNVTQNIFLEANGEALGDIAQDMIVKGDYGYIAVNNSQKVEVVNICDFSSAKTISGISYPRHFAASSDKVYLSNGSMAGVVYEIDPASNSIVDSVSVGNGPEQMIVKGSDLLVTNSGGWGADSTISVVTVSSMTETEKVEVGPAPVAIAEDANGDVWVLSRGKQDYDENWAVVGGVGSKLVKLSGSDYSVESTVELGDYMSLVSKMVISNDGNTIYFSNNGIYRMDISQTEPEASPFITETSVTGLAVNEDGHIVVMTGDYASNGTVKIYDEAGNLSESHETGIAPNGIAE